jgi:hypothetical protein
MDSHASKLAVVVVVVDASAGDVVTVVLNESDQIPCDCEMG